MGFFLSFSFSHCSLDIVNIQQIIELKLQLLLLTDFMYAVDALDDLCTN